MSDIASVLFIIAGFFLLQLGKAILAAMCANNEKDEKDIFIAVLSFQIPAIRNKIDYEKFCKMELGLYAAWLLAGIIVNSLVTTPPPSFGDFTPDFTQL